MCGRFALSPKTDSIEKLRPNIHVQKSAPIISSYNISPSQNIIIERPNINMTESFKWGFNFMNKLVFNSRIESIVDKPYFTNLFNNFRCIIFASGYYEWKLIGGKKIPHYIFLTNHDLFAFGGLWKKDGNTSVCSIITQPSINKIDNIHNRMPLILPKDLIDSYLNNAILNPKEISHIANTKINEELTYHRVSDKMNSSKYNEKDCFEPLSNL